MCIILIDWLNVTIWLKRCTLLEEKNALLKVKIYLNLNEKINFYHWGELTTQNMKNIKNCSCPR